MKAQMETILIILVVIAALIGLFYFGPSFPTMLANLQQVGFYNYILPFVLVFAVSYAIIRSTKVIGADWIIFIISLIIAFFAMLFLSTVPILGFFASFFGRVGVILVILVMIFIVYGFLTKKEEKK